MTWRIKCSDWTDPTEYPDKAHAERVAESLNEPTFRGACALPHTVEETPDDRPEAPSTPQAGSTLF